jgi:SP family sugar:H+ symporter-like MFS transporter
VNVHNDDDNSAPTEGSRTYAIIVCVFAALGGLFFGYDQGVTSGVLIMPSFLEDYCVGWHNFTYEQCTLPSPDLPSEVREVEPAFLLQPRSLLRSYLLPI